MSTFDFLLMLKQSGVKIWVEDDRLHCTGPAQVLSSEVREQLSARKPEIIAFLKSTASTQEARSSSAVPIQPLGGRRPFFAVPGHNGDIFCYVDLARELGVDQPFFALQAPGMELGQTPLESVESIASLFARDIATVQPQGPYLLGGFCLGGAIAFELAQQLTAQGHQVSLLALLGSACPTACAPQYRAQTAMTDIAGRFLRHGSRMFQKNPSEWPEYLRERAAGRRAARERERQNPLRLRLTEVTVEAFKAYKPQNGDFPVRMLLPNDEPDSLAGDRPLDWGLFAKDFGVDLGPAGADMNTILLEPHVSVLARLLENRIKAATSAHSALTA